MAYIALSNNVVMGYKVCIVCLKKSGGGGSVSAITTSDSNTEAEKRTMVLDLSHSTFPFGDNVGAGEIYR
jgi:hypothetical protein